MEIRRPDALKRAKSCALVIGGSEGRRERGGIPALWGRKYSGLAHGTCRSDQVLYVLENLVFAVAVRRIGAKTILPRNCVVARIAPRHENDFGGRKRPRRIGPLSD